jgi:regulator of cell morphogenesis and NO signaling
MTTSVKHSVSAVLSEHDELEEQFDRHQRALLTRDIAAADATIGTFENALQRHIEYEEQVLLPLYAEKKAEIEGATLPIFYAEHRKLREMCANLRRKTAGLYDSPDVLGSILKLFDEETLFKGLFSHHALREKNLLFPRLDAYTTESEREKALAFRAGVYV